MMRRYLRFSQNKLKLLERSVGRVELFGRVLDSCMREGLSKRRIIKYKLVLKKMIGLQIQLRGLSQSDVDKFYFYLQQSSYKDWTKYTEWKIFKKICRIVEAKVSFEGYTIRMHNRSPEILSIEEITRMIEKSRNFRNRLIMTLLYESGCRIGELLNLTKKDVIFDVEGCLVTFNGKTGYRTIRIIDSTDMLRKWIKNKDENERIFNISTSLVNHKIMRRMAMNADITRRIYPHLFRHTRATHLAKYLTEPEMRIYFGWANASPMPSIYVHLSGRDVERKIIELRKSGIGGIAIPKTA